MFLKYVWAFFNIMHEKVKNRSSRSKMFFRIGVLKNFAGKQLCQSLFLIKLLARKTTVLESLFNKVAGLRPQAWKTKQEIIFVFLWQRISVNKFSPWSEYYCNLFHATGLRGYRKIICHYPAELQQILFGEIWLEIQKSIKLPSGLLPLLGSMFSK